MKYALRERDRYALRKDLRKMRLAQKALLLRMQAKFPVNCTSEERRQDYLNYIEKESLRAVSRQRRRFRLQEGNLIANADYVYNDTGCACYANNDTTICQ